MQKAPKQVWFPAKKYGWGWGLPCSWQGWVAFFIWLILLCAGLSMLSDKHLGWSIAWGAVLSVSLFVLCLVKGERPRWRWGKD